jgi:hypothetical protein
MRQHTVCYVIPINYLVLYSRRILWKVRCPPYRDYGELMYRKGYEEGLEDKITGHDTYTHT